MTWNSVWPLGTASVKANEATGANNTAHIETTLNVDHYWTLTSAGKHKQVTLPVSATAPTPAANDLTLYSKNTTGGSCLFMARDGSPLLSAQLTSAGIGTPTTATNGVTFLPSDPAVGGLLMQWGKVIGAPTVSSSGTITFPVAFKTGTVPFSIQLTLNSSSDNYGSVTGIPINTQFTYKVSTSSASGLFWMAIGQAPD